MGQRVGNSFLGVCILTIWITIYLKSISLIYISTMEYFKEINASTYEDIAEGYIEPIYNKEYMNKFTYMEIIQHAITIKIYKKKYSKYTKQYDVEDLQSYIKLDTELTNLTNEFITNENRLDKITTNEIQANNYLKRQQLQIYVKQTNKNIRISINEYNLYYNDIVILKKEEAQLKRMEYKKEYYQLNKIKKNMQTNLLISNAVHILCDCGTFINPYKKSQHLKTKKHHNLIVIKKNIIVY